MYMIICVCLPVCMYVCVCVSSYCYHREKDNALAFILCTNATIQTLEIYKHMTLKHGYQEYLNKVSVVLL